MSTAINEDRHEEYVVRLEAGGRRELGRIVGSGKRLALTVRHANILLAVDESQSGAKLTDVEAARAFGVSVRSVEYLRQRLVEEGLASALERCKQTSPGVERMFDGEKEAKLIAVACGPKPQGRTRWTLELLAERVVKLKIAESCSARTVGRVLKKTISNPGCIRCGAFCRSSTPSSYARWRMFQPRTSGLLTRRVRSSASPRRAGGWSVRRVSRSLPGRTEPGRAGRRDYEYVRNGTANLFIFVEPLRGWRHVNVTSRRTKTDFAGQMKELVDVHYPGAEKITLVMDNLDTHRMSCLYEAFVPEEARQIIERIEVVHTPKDGGWLNMAEREPGVH